MSDRDAHHLDRKIDQISDELPESAGAVLRWLRTPSSLIEIDNQGERLTG